VPKVDAGRLANDLRVTEHPDVAAGLSAESRKTGARYDIAAFVRKMERL
jgi:hypothetical protein